MFGRPAQAQYYIEDCGILCVCQVKSSNTSRLEGHAGFSECLWRRSFDSDVLWPHTTERKTSSLHGQRFTPTPKFLSTAQAYFVYHIGPIFQISSLGVRSLWHGLTWATNSYYMLWTTIIYARYHLETWNIYKSALNYFLVCNFPLCQSNQRLRCSALCNFNQENDLKLNP